MHYFVLASILSLSIYLAFSLPTFRLCLYSSLSLPLFFFLSFYFCLSFSLDISLSINIHVVFSNPLSFSLRGCFTEHVISLYLSHPFSSCFDLRSGPTFVEFYSNRIVELFRCDTSWLFTFDVFVKSSHVPICESCDVY